VRKMAYANNAAVITTVGGAGATKEAKQALK
jgi:hypothetical protein